VLDERFVWNDALKAAKPMFRPGQVGKSVPFQLRALTLAHVIG